MKKKKKILIAEDESDIRDIMCEFLKSEKLEFVHVSNGKEAWQILTQDHSIAMLICDVEMPELNGVKLSQKIKDINPNMPIICVSGYASDKTYKDTLPQVVDAILPKPFDGIKLRKTVFEILKIKN